MIDAQGEDIIREVINIGIGDAASALSDLAGTRVIIRTPEVRFLDIAEVPVYIRQEVGTVGVYISQDFHGSVDGRALLFYTTDCSVSLLRAILKDGRGRGRSLSKTDMATLQEIGNIILGACLATIGNFIEGRFRFSMPHVTLEISETYFRNLVRELESFEKAVILKTAITIETDDIQGYLFFLLSFQDFHILVERLTSL